MVDISKVRAIDIHTHAEEPCGCHADDGYDELQSTMAKYFLVVWLCRYSTYTAPTAANKEVCIVFNCLCWAKYQPLCHTTHTA